jgi:hypothetical protein
LTPWCNKVYIGKNRRKEMKVQYKTVKVPEWAYNNALAMRGQIIRHGIEVLPEPIREPQKCPSCGGEVTRTSIGFEHVVCAAGCGFEQQTVEASGNTLKAIGIGALFGIGLTALGLALVGGSSRPSHACNRTSRKYRLRDRR